MADYDLSRIVDTNGDNWNIKAKALESQIQISLSGDVTGSKTSDLSENVAISATIGNGKVTNAKLADGSVSSGKLADGSVTLAKIATSAKDGAVSDNDGKLATHAQVKSAIDAAIAGQGSYLGKQPVATINTWTAANLQNGDRCIASDAGTVTLGNIAVRAGEDLIFWKTGTGDSQTAIWQSMDGEFKLKQTAKGDPSANGTTLTAIATITQNANGEITATKKTIQSATTSAAGVMSAADKTKLDGIATGANKTTVDTALSTTSANPLQNKIVASELAKKKNTQTAVTSPSSNGNTTAFIDTISQNSQGVITATKKTIPNATTSAAGLMTAAQVQALNAKETNFAINYRASDHALVFHKTFGSET